MTVTFEVTGQPLPKERVHFNGRTRRAYTASRTRAWEETVGWAALAAMKGRAPLEGDVTVGFSFRRQTLVRADLDNLIKAVCDGMNGIAYLDDKQIVGYQYAHLIYGVDDPGVCVRVEHAIY